MEQFVRCRNAYDLTYVRLWATLEYRFVAPYIETYSIVLVMLFCHGKEVPGVRPKDE